MKSCKCNINNLNFPKCKNCLSYLIFKLSLNTIILYCDKCLNSFKIPLFKHFIDQTFLNQIESHMVIEQYNNDIECDKCKKRYCSYCFRDHVDYINSYFHFSKHLNTKEINKESNKQNYENYNIKCDHCGRQYNNGIVYLHGEKRKISEIKQEFIKAQNHLNYYEKLKNSLINEICQKINKIENSYTVNHSYHMNIFELINQLLLWSKQTQSESVRKSLDNLTHFNFPFIDLTPIDNLNDKIDALNKFYQNEYLIKDKAINPLDFLQNVKTIIHDYPLLKLPNNKILSYTKNKIEIYNQYNFQRETKFYFGDEKVFDVQIIDNNNCFVTAFDKFYKCHFNKNEYLLEDFIVEGKPFYTRNIDVLPKNNLFIINERNNILFISGQSPHTILHRAPFNGKVEIEKNYELNDNKILVIINEFIQNKAFRCDLWFLFYRPDLSLEKKIKIDFPPGQLKFPTELIEIDMQKIIMFSNNFILLFNYVSEKIETKIFIGSNEKAIQSIKAMPKLEAIVVILHNSFKIINIRSFQQVFEIYFNDFVYDYLLLGNGTLLGFCYSSKKESL